MGETWGWVLIVAAMTAMFFFGTLYGLYGCGFHGKKPGNKRDEPETEQEREEREAVKRQEDLEKAFQILRSYDAYVAYGLRDGEGYTGN